MNSIFFKTILILFLQGNLFGQNHDLNLGFEQLDENKMPTGWVKDYSTKLNFRVGIDSIVKKQGKYALRINSDTICIANDSTSYLRFSIPDKFTDYNYIELKGFVKTENVLSDKFGGLYFGIVREKDYFPVYDSLKLSPTINSDWREFSIKLHLPVENMANDSFVVRCGLNTKGTIWFDDLRLYIDSVPFEKASLTKFFRASTDFEFYNHSKVELSNASDKQIKNLTLLGKIWGFLKYHHPKIAAGEYNWDYELFRIMPEIITDIDNETRNKILIDWINSLGIISQVNLILNDTPSKIKQKPDFSWFINSSLNKNLVTKLNFIKKNHCESDNYYVKIQNGIGNAVFLHEDTYDEKKYPDVGIRLLALFRYWNMVQYYFPYRYAITEETWDSVLERLIPKMVNANNAAEYRLVLLSLLNSIHDSHAILITDPLFRKVEGSRKSSAQITFIDGKAVVSGYIFPNSCEKDKLLPGDIILEINDETIENILTKRLPYTSGSNKVEQLANISYLLLRNTADSIKIKISRNDSLIYIIGKDVGYYEIPKPANNYSLLSKNAGYIDMGYVKFDQLPQIFNEFKNTKGIVLDLRKYPSDFQLIENLGNYLMPKPKTFVKFSKCKIDCPGFFEFKDSENIGIVRPDFYKGKIAILVNETTQSHAEYSAMAYRQAPNAKVIGSQTSGADGDITFINLPGGYVTIFSGIGVYYPDGKESQRIGIVPDIEVKPTIKGIKEGKDEVLEKAIEYINKN